MSKGFIPKMDEHYLQKIEIARSNVAGYCFCENKMSICAYHAQML